MAASLLLSGCVSAAYAAPDCDRSPSAKVCRPTPTPTPTPTTSSPSPTPTTTSTPTPTPTATTTAPVVTSTANPYADGYGVSY